MCSAPHSETVDAKSPSSWPINHSKRFNIAVQAMCLAANRKWSSNLALFLLQSDSELLVESYSEDEDEGTKKVSSPDNVAAAAVSPTAASEIRSLIERKEELERRQRRQDRHRQRVQVSLASQFTDQYPSKIDCLQNLSHLQSWRFSEC